MKDHRLSIFITLQVDCYILKNKNNKVKIIDLGISPFLNSWKYQDELFDSIISVKVSNRKTKIKALTNNYMIFVEHPAVYTLGNSGKIENLLVDKNILNEKNIEFYKTNRGGDITFHGYESGIVYLHMQGACAGCPSSTATLKGGVENLLKQHLPEVKEVVAENE